MEILKVKYTKDGYLVNDIMHVPNNNRNRHYPLVQDWIEAGGVVEPFETDAEIAAREIAEANQLIYAELDETDKASIRPIREWIASQSSAPKELKDLEKKAQDTRIKLK